MPIMRNRIKNLTIREKLLLFQGLFIVAFFLVVTFYLVTVYSNTLLESERSNVENTVQFLNGNISAQIETINSVDMDVRASSTVKENLNLTDYVEYGRAFTKITDFLSSKVFGVSGLRHAVIIDKKNHVYTVDLPLQLPETFQLEETEVFRKALQSPSKLVWLSYNDIYDLHSLGYGDYRVRSDIHAASIIKNYTSGEIQGLLILTLNENYFRNIAKSVPQMDSLKIYLLSSDLEKCYPLTENADDALYDVIDSIPLKGEKHGSVIHNGNMITYELNSEMGWYVVSMIGIRTLQKDVERHILPLLAIIGVSLLLFFAISNRVFNSMTKGINNLSLSMRQFETGDFNVRIEKPANDEIGQLSQSFNHMAAQINELIDTQYKMVVKTREAEYKSLQAQINPHFLYNTLDMLNWQLVLHGEERLSESVVALGNCLRYSISDNGAESTLHRELENVKNYVAIQTLINEKPVEMAVQAEDAELIRLPKLTLQPLVENIFLHGFKGRDTNNSMSIIGKYDEEKRNYSITVSDNGIGMTEEQLHSIINGNLSGDESHVGLGNVISRLHYMYKDNVDVDIKSNYGFGTEICIKLALEGEAFDETGNN